MLPRKPSSLPIRCWPIGIRRTGYRHLPMFGRIISEKTRIDLARVFGILFRAGKFPQPPRSMYVPDATGTKLKLAMPEVSYTSRLALALKSMQNKATVNSMQFVFESIKATGRTDLLDNWDLDRMFRDYALAEGQSARYERPMRQVIELRSERAKMAQAQQAMAMAEQASKTAKNLGGAPEAMQDSIAEQLPQGGAAA